MPATLINRIKVAPFAGVWIEIYEDRLGVHVPVVAPFAGVWIEIYGDWRRTCKEWVAPFAGVWIEIPANIFNAGAHRSHPSRVCGLKFKSFFDFVEFCLSHPSRVCGLKFRSGKSNSGCPGVAPFAGVWIEIGS